MSEAFCASCRVPDATKASSLYLLADSALQALLQCVDMPQHSSTFKNCLKYLLRLQGSGEWKARSSFASQSPLSFFSCLMDVFAWQSKLIEASGCILFVKCMNGTCVCFRSEWDLWFAAIQVGEYFVPLRTCIECVGSSLRASRVESIVSLCTHACQQTQVQSCLHQQIATRGLPDRIDPLQERQSNCHTVSLLQGSWRIRQQAVASIACLAQLTKVHPCSNGAFIK